MNVVINRPITTLVVLDKWTKIIDDGGVIDSIHCDFKKVFGTVPYKCLLKKTESFGIKWGVLNWIHTFLSEELNKQ